MIRIIVWCLPPDQNEDDLNHLHQVIVKAAVSVVPELCLPGKKSITCLSPADFIKFESGERIWVEIDRWADILWEKPTVREQLDKCVRESVLALYPEAKTKCSVKKFNKPLQGIYNTA
jgi:hypothetical protein